MTRSDAALRMLIVCSANRFRSPLAECLMRQEFAEYMIHVESAGIHAAEGAPAHQAARTVALEHGLIGIEAHRTRRLTPQLISDADLILTMDEQQQHAVIRAMPTYTGRVLLLGCWRGVNVGDPIVTSENSRRWIFGLLSECVADWRQRMTLVLGSLVAAREVQSARRVH